MDAHVRSTSTEDTCETERTYRRHCPFRRARHNRNAIPLGSRLRIESGECPCFDPDSGVAHHYVHFYRTGLDLRDRPVRSDASADVGADGPFEIVKTAAPSQRLHVGGSIRSGPDGKLCFAVGDNRHSRNGQVLSNPLTGELHGDGALARSTPKES
jgi:hypothetical protein